ncbi:uncharacterized protein BDV14DRAFT_172646 [Aspergillus stella-maris]|uniref:uncharacterized protein n=1 Tax=Aspergillus stella-maris TaxID=1810926 RepID=UPI003CCE0844
MYSGSGHLEPFQISDPLQAAMADLIGRPATGTWSNALVSTSKTLKSRFLFLFSPFNTISHSRMALSSITKPLSIVLLSSWTLTALGFTALDVLNNNRTLTEVIASISLLTFLVCRLFVASQPKDESSIAQLLTTAYTRSRAASLTLLLLAGSWLYELLWKTVALFFVTLFGGVFAAAIYNDAFVKQADSMNNDVNVDNDLDSTTAALAEINEFQKNTGLDVDPTELFKMIPPKLLVYVAVLVWLNFATLGLYVLKMAWRGVRGVLGSRVESKDVGVVTGFKREAKVE